jgi:ABC-2 type transport system ATP-binding protein
MTTDGDSWAIDARGLTKTFGTLTAVRGVTLQVPTGTIFAFLGPNGSGKSTTVKLLTGLLAPTSGEARVTGRVVSADDLELRRRIGILPEDDALFPDLTIWEHLELCGRLYGLSRQETDARAIQLLRHLDLQQGRTTLVEKASFGMRKKCALAMALLHNPRVLFLDEPFEGIDPGSFRNIKDLLLALAERGVAVFLTSHILEIVERLCTDVGIIAKGKLVHQGTMAELKQTGSLEDKFLAVVGDHEHDGQRLSWLEG